MKITDNFDSTEFDCKCGCNMPSEVASNVLKLCGQLEILRSIFDAPIRINSGYRCETYNKKIGGVKNSQHILGKAADIVVKGYKPHHVFNAIEFFTEIYDDVEIKGLGKYETFTHVDIRNSEKLITWEN